jgi:hypothetical protein
MAVIQTFSSYIVDLDYLTKITKILLLQKKKKKKVSEVLKVNTILGQTKREFRVRLEIDRFERTIFGFRKKPKYL